MVRSDSRAETAFARFVEGWCPYPLHKRLTADGWCDSCAATWAMQMPGILTLVPDAV